MTAGPRATAVTGMIVFLGSLSMAAVAMLVSFGVLRDGASPYPPAAVADIPGGLAGAGAAIAALASAVLIYGQRAGRPVAIGAAAALGAAFLVCQEALARALAGAGLSPVDPVGGMMYALIGFQAAHAAVAAPGLFAAALLARRRRRHGAGEGAAVQLWSMFWHYAAALWLAIAAAVFVV